MKEESEALVAAVRQGLLPEADIDRAVRRLFTARMKLGMFDPATSVPYAIDTDVRERHRRASRAGFAHRPRVTRSVEEQRSLLPLGTRYMNIAVIGPNADSVSALVGNYNGTPSRPVTLLAASARASRTRK